MAFMASPSSVTLADLHRAALDGLVIDLRTIFGARLHSVVAYGLAARHNDDDPLRTLALVEQLTFDDLARAAPMVPTWQRRGLAVPLILSEYEFDRTLDVFPLEYGSIIADHIVVVGRAPFDDTKIDDSDRRRGCEQQAKSHLIHLREGFLETRNETRQIGLLITSSAAAFQTLLVNIVRLEGGDWRAAAVDNSALAAFIEQRLGVSEAVVGEVLSSRDGIGSVAEPSSLLARYIEASERIWRYVDRWRG
jgi:hypothetical protein